MKSETKRPLDVLLRAVANPIIALILAFLLSGLVVLISGDDPMEAYAAILQGAFGSKSNLINTVRYMLPILMLALSFTLCDSCGYFNIGQEGQMYSAVVTMAWIQHAFGGLERGLFFEQLTDCRHDHPLRDIRRGVLGGGNRRGDHTDAANHAVQRTDQSPTGTEPDVG